MGSLVRIGYAVLLACSLAACSSQAAPPRQEVAVVVVPKVVEARQAIQETVPIPEVVVKPAETLTASLISRWEIGSPSLYNTRYQFPLWPGNASGITIGVGYDLGYNTTFHIERDWERHEQVSLLSTASGITGPAARSALPRYKVVRTPFSLAESVFRYSTLPAYVSSAKRALGPKFELLPEGARAALVSLGYNRGWSMAGTRRQEMRVIRDSCVPKLDVHCIAAELRSMKRLWPETKGLRDRREDEAKVAEES